LANLLVSVSEESVTHAIRLSRWQLVQSWRIPAKSAGADLALLVEGLLAFIASSK